MKLCAHIERVALRGALGVGGGRLPSPFFRLPLLSNATIVAMLERLAVSSLGIIEAVTLEIGEGLVALTGETGAGKSLLVESLNLLAGQRAQADLVRSGDEVLRVEGRFAASGGASLSDVMAELGLPEDDVLVIRREVSAGGRSRAWVNDVSVTVGALQRLAPHLLAIHGQHEQYGLGDPAEQRRLVDEYAGHDELRAAVTVSYARWESAADELARLERARGQRRDRLDAIRFQLAELDAADPRPGEDEELLARRRVLRHAARLQELGSGLLDRLAERDAAVIAELARAERETEEMAELGLPLVEAAARLDEARVQVEEVVREVQGLCEGVGEDPGELEGVESRLHLLDQLMLKYGSPLDKVVEHRERLVAEQAELDGVEDRLGEARAAAGDALAAYDEAARRLQRSREQAGHALGDSARAVLARLNMGGTRLELRWQAASDPQSPLQRDGRAVRFDDAGVEECELLIAPNPGEELRPMARIASGGELSRLHLALRTVLRSRHDAVRMTLLFDEVDSGLGGATAAALGSLLEELAAVDQVLVVTHLPQVAARASAQLRVEKVVVDGRAVTKVLPLAADERVMELARMLAGDEVGASAVDHARALLSGGA